MITKEDIERLGKAQQVACEHYVETLISSGFDVAASRIAFAEQEAAVKAWFDAAREFAKQKVAE